MKKTLRSAAIPAVIGVALSLVLAGTANAQRFAGTFAAPHARFSIAIGSPFYPAGSHVSYGHRISYLAPHGYGFHAPARYGAFHRVRHAFFVPVRRFHRRFVVVAPRFHGHGARYGRYCRPY